MTPQSSQHLPGVGLIAPSLLAADFTALGDEMRDLRAAGADLIHFDVVDNRYGPNLTIGQLPRFTAVERVA